MQAPLKAMIFSGDQRPDFSRRKGISSSAWRDHTGARRGRHAIRMTNG